MESDFFVSIKKVNFTSFVTGIMQSSCELKNLGGIKFGRLLARLWTALNLAILALKIAVFLFSHIVPLIIALVQDFLEALKKLAKTSNGCYWNQKKTGCRFRNPVIRCLLYVYYNLALLLCIDDDNTIYFSLT